MSDAMIIRRGASKQKADDIIKSNHGILTARSRLNTTDNIAFAKYPDVIQAGNVPGLVALALPSSGSWSTTFSNGSRGRTVTTDIAEGQSKGVYIDSFPDIQPATQGFSLFQSGSLYPGYTLRGGTIDGSELLTNSAFWIDEPVSGRSNVQIVGSLKNGGSGIPRIYIGSSPIESSFPNNPEITALWLQEGTGNYILQISLLNSGICYIGGVFGSNPAGITQILFY